MQLLRDNLTLWTSDLTVYPRYQTFATEHNHFVSVNIPHTNQ
uniref:Uncharacterized protein n=1 Tax=Arundo donax TaxID=35708 RepID=A0A0A9G3C8_ARUDO